MRDSVLPGDRRPRWFAVIGGLLALGLLAWTLRDVQIGRLLEAARRADPRWLLLATLLFLAPMLPRVFRWQLLLGDQADATRHFGPLWHATTIGFMANNLLPARMGELARAVSIQRLAGLPISTALASIAIARVLDALCLIGFLALAAVAGGLGPSASDRLWRAPQWELVVALGTVLIVGCVLAIRSAWLRRTAKTLASRLIPKRYHGVVADGLGNALSVFRGLRDLRRSSAALALTLLIWTTNGFAFWAGLRAFAIPVDTAGAFMIQSLIGVGIALVPSPGYFGPFEAASRFVLDMWEIAPSTSASFAFLIHLVIFLPITALGLLSLVLSPLYFRELTGATRRTP